MYEKRLKELSDKFEIKEQRVFYILTHKKHAREIYFQNNKAAINFMENKLISPLKKFKKIKITVYLLIRLGVLQPFLRKIKLPSKFGDVIFVAGQVKGFDLKKKEVISFPLSSQFW